MTKGAAGIVTAGLRPTSLMQAESNKEKSGVSVLSRCMLKNCIDIQPLLTAFKVTGTNFCGRLTNVPRLCSCN